MIGIRADGNNQIGIGHVMRCMTIADALKECGAEVMFFLADSECEELVSLRGYKCCVLGSCFDDMEAELPDLKPLIKEHHVDRMLIDSYYVTEEYLKALRAELITVYLDDMDRFPYLVDLLINYNVFAKALDYPYGVEYAGERKTQSIVKEDVTQVLAGPLYAPVRKEFSEHKAIIKDAVSDVLITLGGSDANNLSYKIAERLLQETSAMLHIVCGPFNLHKAKLYELAKKESRVLIHENVKDMWNLMQNCDLAVSAAGSTMCELAVAGVPTVTFSFVENQRRIAKAFDEQSAAVGIGHYVSSDEFAFLAKVSDAVKDLIADKEHREALVKKASCLVDGQGAVRIARAILEY